MLLKMARIQIIGTRAQLDSSIATLQRLGALQIEDATKSSALKYLALDDANLRLQEELGFLAARLDALIQILPPAESAAQNPEWNPPSGSRDLAAWMRDQLDQAAPAIQALAQKRDELQAELMSLPRYETTLRKLAPLAVELRELQGFDTVALLIDRRYRDVLGLIRVEVERLTHSEYEIIARELDERTTAAVLIYPRQFAADVQSVLGQENITQVRLPKELAGRTFRDSLLALERRQFAIREELARIDAELSERARRWRPQLVVWRREIKNRQQALATRSQFAATNYTFVVEGWVPKRELIRVRETLAREIGPEVIVEEIKTNAAEREHTPVAFDNPAPLKPFEMLVRIMSLPRYGAFDPTPLMAIFLPLFFGIILGDVAYGALVLLLAIYVRRHSASPTIRSLAQVLIYGSLWAIVFGFLYGEFLGTLGPAVGLHPIWMSREGNQILALFAFSVALGVIQVVMGLLLGVWEALREKHRSELVSKIGMLIILSAIFGVVGVARDMLPDQFFTPAVILALLGLVMLIVPSGAMGLVLGPLEVLETFTNVMSYLRLAAIGLSSVYLAMVANKMAGIFGNVVVGVIVALLLHSLNFALGILSPTIQSLRLHYVEFFRQFYQSGGEEYRPFKTE
jgi:V/A-type H+/Na+-transporting ATPase subunit I